MVVSGHIPGESCPSGRELPGIGATPGVSQGPEPPGLGSGAFAPGPGGLGAPAGFRAVVAAGDGSRIARGPGRVEGSLGGSLGEVPDAPSGTRRALNRAGRLVGPGVERREASGRIDLRAAAGSPGLSGSREAGRFSLRRRGRIGAASRPGLPATERHDRCVVEISSAAADFHRATV